MIRPFYDNLSIQIPWLFYWTGKTTTCVPETVFCDRFWDEREHWYNAGVGIVTGTTRAYFGPIPERPAGPLIGTPEEWLNGLSYARWIAGGYSDPVGCWPVGLLNLKLKLRQRQALLALPYLRYQLRQKQGMALVGAPQLGLRQQQSLTLSAVVETPLVLDQKQTVTLTAPSVTYTVRFWVWVAMGDVPNSVSWTIYGNASGLPEETFVSSGTGGTFSYAGTDRGGFGFDIYEGAFDMIFVGFGGNLFLQLLDATTTESGSVFWDISNGPSVGYNDETGPTANACGDGNSESCSFEIMNGASLVYSNCNSGYPGTYYGNPGGVDCEGAWDIDTFDMYCTFTVP